MKKTISTVLFCLLPVLVMAHDRDNIVSINLEMNQTVSMYNIVYTMNDGERLVSNLHTDGQDEEGTKHRIYSVTKNIPIFHGFARSDVDRLFDWDYFDTKRNAIRVLVATVVEQAQEQNVDTATLLWLLDLRTSL